VNITHENELQYEQSTAKFVDLPKSNFTNYTNSLTFQRLWVFSLTLAEISDISRFPEIPGKWKHLKMQHYTRTKWNGILIGYSFTVDESEVPLM